MKYKKSLISLLSTILILSACSSTLQTSESASIKIPDGAHIFLCGEAHQSAVIKEHEYELWYDYYHTYGMRHLFVEYGYCTAELLNLWMQSDNDEIWDVVYENWRGTLAHESSHTDFYHKIKEQCPETIFHGTDIEHQFNSTGQYYLTYLENSGLTHTEQYELALESIEQGRYFYANGADFYYREETMAENLMREFDALDGECVMGIYGLLHTDPDGEYPIYSDCMAKQLKVVYGDALHSLDLTYILEDFAPLYTQALEIGGKEYEATFYGRVYMANKSETVDKLAIWRLENAWDDFKRKDVGEGKLDYDIFPMQLEENQVFVVDFENKDGTVERRYFRSDENCPLWEMPYVVEFILDK